MRVDSTAVDITANNGIVTSLSGSGRRSTAIAARTA